MIGSGIFTTSGFILKDIPDPRIMLLAWVVGGLFALCGALCYAELGALFPRAGGDYIFLRESIGKPCAFLSGWISLWVGFSAPIAAVALAFAAYLIRLSPALSVVPVPVIASAPILILTAAHLRGVHSGIRIQNILTVIKIALLVAFIAGGLASGRGSFDHFVPQEPVSFSWHSFASSLVFILFAYSGWNASAYVGGEARQPGRNLPRSIIGGVLLVALLYVLMNVVYIYAAPAASLAGQEEVAYIAGINLFGAGIGGAFNLGVLICLLASVSSMILTGPRVYYAMASDGLFFGIFAKVDQHRRVPAPALILQAALALVMVWTASFEALLIYIGVLLAVFSALTVLGLMILRHTRPALDRPYRTWGYPVTPVLFIAGSLWVVYSQASTNPVCVAYSAATLLAGGLCYRLFNKIS